MARLRLVAMLMAAALAMPAGAASTGVTVTPASFGANVQSTLPVTLVWTVRLPFIATAAPPPSVSSMQAQVTTPSGEVLQVDSTALTVPLTQGVGSVAETFTLAPATVAAALRQGVGRLLLKRSFGSGILSFTGAPLATTGVVQIELGGSAGGPLNLSRVALHFDDRSLVRVLRNGEAALAIAEINYSGSGLLSGLWEIASPPSTQGEPVFVPLASVNINLGGGGLNEVTSPTLPANGAGVYYIRFRVREPVVAFTGVVVRYAVEDGTDAAPAIEVVGPPQAALLLADTPFQWRAAPDAVAYRLEFFESEPLDEEAQPVFGAWVPAEGRDTLLSALAQSHLQPGRQYHWRVVAWSAQGRVVAHSALFEIRTP